MFWLADRIGTTVEDVRALSLDDYYGHVAYFHLKDEAKSKNAKRLERKMGKNQNSRKRSVF